MSAGRILYVSYDPLTLVRDEQLLRRSGYFVDTVFGLDGLMARSSLSGFSSILVDEACPTEDRKKIVAWVRQIAPKVTILPSEWVEQYSPTPAPEPSQIPESSFPAGFRDNANHPELEREVYAAVGSHIGIPIEFRLIYRGKMPAASRFDPRRQEKHELRRQFNIQLRQLWKQDPTLSVISSAGLTGADREPSSPVIQSRADNYARCGYRFLPLVTRDEGLVCHLDVLLMRNDDFGQSKRAGGACDHLELFVDALRAPRTCDELCGSTPDINENPFFVLMEDESSVGEVKITADRLLLPVATNEVVVIVSVRTALSKLLGGLANALSTARREHYSATRS